MSFPICNDLPSRNQDFVGRQDILKELDDILLPKEGNPQKGFISVALCGLGGIGKTTIATEFVHSRKGYFDAIFWLKPTTMESEYLYIARSLQLEHNPTDGYEPIKKWFRDPVKSLPNGKAGKARWLLVFDGFVDPAGLTKYWPDNGTGSVIITSRNPESKRAPWSTVGIDVPGLSDNEGSQLLRAYAKKESGGNRVNAQDKISHLLNDGVEGEKLCQDISRLLSGIPAAIKDTINTKLAFLQSLKKVLKETDEDTKYEKAKKSITIMYRYGRLADKWGISYWARQILQVTSALHDEDIEEENSVGVLSATIFETLTENYKTDMRKAKLIDRIEAQDQLVRNGLLTLKENDTRYYAPPIVRTIMRAWNDYEIDFKEWEKDNK